jgi:prophage regulatory protein
MAAQLHIRLIKLREVQATTALSRSAIYQLERDGKFPKRVSIGLRAAAWKSDEIAEWIESRARRVA